MTEMRKPGGRYSRCSPTPRPMAGRGRAHRYPCGLGVPRRRACVQGQARGALSFPRLFHPRQAQAACEAELEVNRPFAPDIYRRVVAITREDDGGSRSTAPARRSSGRSRCAASTRTRPSTAGGHGQDRRGAGGRARPRGGGGPRAARPGRGRPWIKALADYIDEHVAAFGETPELFPPDEVEALARASRAAYARIHPLLVERGRRGLVRRIHGDLHLGNIVLLEGRPVLFDAIEFSPLIASGDVLYDLAFLLMDLTERGLGRPPISCSTATSSRPGGRKTSTPWQRCRSSCRCARRSAPR